jgi:L-lactate dehydrogenase
MTAAPILLGSEPVADLVTELFVRHGATTDNARQVADHLVDASRAGVRSHGLLRVPQYLDDIARGETDPAALPGAETARHGGRCVVDGRHAFGQVAGNWAVERTLSLASAHGLGAVTVHHIGHAGRIGAYVESAALRGAVALAVCSGPPDGHRVAPFGALDGRLATNPIAYAYPASPSPVVADFATSASTEGQIRHCLLSGSPAPTGSLQDADGNPTIDPSALYADPPGTLLPLGGERYGHKGYALGLLVETLATLLGGDEADDHGRWGNNLFLIVIPVDDDFQGRADRMGRYIRSARASDGRPIQLPGDRERATGRADDRIPVDTATWTAIRAASLGCGIGASAIERCAAR